MEFALIKNGIVENVIVADQTFVDSISGKYDFVIQVDTLPEKPSPKWTYDGVNFIKPVPPVKVENQAETRVKAKKGTVSNLNKSETDALLEDLITLVTGV